MALRIVDGPALEWSEKDLGSMLFARAAASPDEPAFLVREGDEFTPWTRREVATRVREIAAGLITLGIKPGERVAILADTSPEWALADFGILCAGGVTVTIYPTLPAEQVRDLLEDSGSVAVFADTAAQQAKLAEVLGRASHIRHWLALDALDGAVLARADADVRKRATTLAALREEGRRALDARPGLVEERLVTIQSKDLSTIIYTSGTTGVPKGAALSHENWIVASRSLTLAFGLEDYDERTTIAFLPLAHVLTRLMLIVFVDVGGVVAFSSARTFGADLAKVQPAAIVCVPRIWERMFQQVHKVVAEQPASRRAVFARAEAVARAYGHAIANGGRAPLALRLQHALFERLVYRKLRARLGMSRMLGALSTAAAIRPDLLAFYQGIGVKVVELWGMTEMAGPGVTNTLARFKPGSVGWPIPGMAVALDEEDEICVSGPNVFDGYHERPEENAASFFEAEGRRWFRTGDVGRFDEDGALRIVDRKKEIEVLDTGKKIAPIAVEERLKTVSRFVAEACLVATGRKYAAVLIQPDFDRLVAWARDEGVAFDESRLVVRPDPTGSPMTYSVGEDLLAAPQVRALFEDVVKRCNALSADFERVRAFHLVPHVFSLDRDEITMTLKKKRRVIHEHYRDEIEAMFF